MALPPGAFRSAVTGIETSTAGERCKARFWGCATFLRTAQSPRTRFIASYSSVLQRHAPELLRNTFVHVVHASFPGVRFRLVDKIVAETDRTFLIFENKRKFILAARTRIMTNSFDRP